MTNTTSILEQLAKKIAFESNKTGISYAPIDPANVMNFTTWKSDIATAANLAQSATSLAKDANILAQSANTTATSAKEVGTHVNFVDEKITLLEGQLGDFNTTMEGLNDTVVTASSNVNTLTEQSSELFDTSFTRISALEKVISFIYKKFAICEKGTHLDPSASEVYQFCANNCQDGFKFTGEAYDPAAPDAHCVPA